MKRRKFISLIVSAIACPMVARAEEKMHPTARATTNRDRKGTGGKTRHRRHDAKKRPQSDGGKSNDYVYGKVHYRLKPAK